MAYVMKASPTSVAKNLLYLMKVMNEAIKLNPPKTLAEAKLLLSNFEVMTSEALLEGEEAFA